MFRLKQPDDTWPSGIAWTRTSTGWRPIIRLWRKTGTSTWSQRQYYDRTPPGKPTQLGLTTDSVNRQVTMRVRMPANTDVMRATLKYSSARYPTVEGDASYIYPGLQSRKDAGPNDTVSWTWTPDFYDRDYYISVWAVDDSLNASESLRAVVKIPPPSAPPPPQVPPLAQITYNAVTSGQWTRTRQAWNPNYYGDLVVQAGLEDYVGGWFYAGKIKTALANKAAVKKMTIRIQRANSSHGVSGAANIYLIPHKLTTVGSGKTPALVPAATRVLVGTLGRGQTKTFNVPSAWWPHFKSGNYTGLGLWAGGASQWSSPNYVLAHGKGTTSGQVYIEAQ